MAVKRLMIIHGRSTKPTQKEKNRLIMEALEHGLNRVDAVAAQLIKNGKIQVGLIYYGDILNQLMVDAQPDLKENMILKEDGIWYEKDGCYDEPMRNLLQRGNDQFGRNEYRKFLKENKDYSFIDNIASVLSPILANGLSRRIIKKFLPDLGAYLTSHKVSSKIRQRLQEPLLKALDDADDIAIISHSMGCIATYDVLWKFSHMSEYEKYHNKKVNLWITIGNPLGEPSVMESLYDFNEPADGKYPRNIIKWINIASEDDFVAHDGTVKDDFREMEFYGCQIIDLPRIFNFWVGDRGTNPHKLYGYLDNPIVAKQIAEWIK